jgi:phenylacetate-CoA ligase
MYNTVFRSVIFPALERYSGTTIKQHLTELRRSEWWSKTQIEELQNKKLRALVRHAFDNVPYYHRIFTLQGITPDDIKTKNDLKKIPILTKDVIRKNLPDLLAKNIPKSKRIESHSSGSTGEPMKYFIDSRSYSADWAQTFRCWGWAGYQIGDPYVKISMNPRTTMVKKIQDITFNTHYLYAQNIHEKNIVKEITSIKTFKPIIIRGYASYMYSISKMMEKMGVEYIGATVATTGDMLYPHYRECIEQRFHCKIFDGYGGEGTPVAFECEEHDGYHICDEDVVVEFLADKECVSPGELGRIVFTNLENYAMPFIRYDIGDVGTYTDEPCSCGRGLSILKSIEGRDSDLIITPGGDIIIVHFFTWLFEFIEGVDQFQVIQDRIDHLTVKIVKNLQFTNNDLIHIKKEIQKKVGLDVTIEINFENEIPLSGRSGKRRFVISKVSRSI